MSPETHLFASWLVAAKSTRSPGDCRLVALAGLLPDADGLGLLADWWNELCFHRSTSYYALYHHSLLHGLFGAVAISAGMGFCAAQKWRVAVLSFLVVHLHLICDLVGSRGPSRGDVWPIYYLSPFQNFPVWKWRGQWPLDGWQNHLINVLLFGICLALAVLVGHSFVGVFNRRFDRIFVEVLRKWYGSFRSKAADMRRDRSA